MAELESVLQFIEDTFGVSEFPDYAHALNGLQLQGPEEINHLAVAVDASEVTIRGALKEGAQLLLVHHGLFWDGIGPISGPRFRKVAALIQGGMALYSLHLPLDAHPDLGNGPLLSRGIGLEPEGTFWDASSGIVEPAPIIVRRIENGDIYDTDSANDWLSSYGTLGFANDTTGLVDADIYIR